MSARILAGWTAALALAATLAGAPPRAEDGGGGAPAPAAVAPAGGPEVRGFGAFCATWMEKLRDRETHNRAHIAWERRDGSVVGERVAYARECECVAREDPGKDPIGRIVYREMRYRHQGATPEAALATPGTIVEQSEVTEIFRFAHGRWQY